MIRPINKNPLTLAQPARKATPQDAAVIQDLKDTLAFHHAECVGMAANMINQPVAIIIAQLGPVAMPLINPEITKQSGAYQTEEGCLSLTGQRPTTRYHHITVRYLDAQFKPRTQTFSDYFAQIIQHECDHLKGILI